MKKLNYVIIILFLLFFVLLFQNINNQILRIQAYFDLSLITAIFWILVLLLSLKILYSDTGFLKIGAVLGIILTGVMFIFLMIIKPNQYDLVNSDNYEVIIEIDQSLDSRVINVYQRNNFFFSKKIHSFQAPDYYDYKYEIIESDLIISRCTEISCINEVISLD